jgi:hypothetical protein
MNAQEEGIQVGFKGKGAPEFDSFDKVLVSIGRTPNGKLIDCEKAGVNVDDWVTDFVFYTFGFEFFFSFSSPSDFWVGVGNGWDGKCIKA